MDPSIRQRGPGRSLASVLGQAKAVRAVGEHVHGVRNLAGRERRSEAIGVFGGNVAVLGGVPDEEWRRLWCDQRIQRCRPVQLRAGVLAEKDQPGRAVGLGLHRRDGVTKHSELHRLIGRGARREGGQPGQMTSRREPDEPDAPVACWAVGMGLYYKGEPGEADRWFAESAALAPASAQWPAGASSLAYRSLIAGEQGNLEEQRMLAESAAELVREHGTEKANGVVPLALGVSLAARGRPEEAQPLIEGGAALIRSRGQPAEAALALLHQGSVLRALGQRERSQAATTEARSIIGSYPDPGALTGRLKACAGSAREETSPGEGKLTRRERRVLQLLTSDLSERDIGHELYVSHNTIHSHVRSIYRKLGVSSRAQALQRTRELRLLYP
jgi:DNA-binding NarL/FixJ family response regulator